MSEDLRDKLGSAFFGDKVWQELSAFIYGPAKTWSHLPLPIGEEPPPNGVEHR